MSRRPDPLDPVVEKVVETDQRVLALEAKTQLREEKERPNQFEAAERVGLPADLMTAEQNAILRHSPLRNRWPEVAEFDERVASLEMRRAGIADELRELHEQAHNAPGLDAQRLANWELSDRKGQRPDPTLPRLEERIKDLQAELDGLDGAIIRVLGEKRAYVERHRSRLMKKADDHKATKHERYLAAIAELEAAREDLAAAQHAARWIRLYPEPQATQEPADSLAGGRKRALTPLGVSAPIALSHLFAALREDAGWVAEAATREQKLIIAGRDPRQPPNTVWAQSDEGQQWQRDERQRALHRLRNPT